MATIVQKVSSVYFLVTLGYVLIDRPGTDQDINYQEVIGSYETLEDAKAALEANAYRIMDNDNQYLKLYKVDLEQNKLHTFYRKDLQAPIQKALKVQKEQDAKAAEKTKLELQKESSVKSRPGRDPWVFHASRPEHQEEPKAEQQPEQQQEGKKVKNPDQPMQASAKKDTGQDFPKPNKGLIETLSTPSIVGVPITVVQKPVTLSKRG